MPFPYHPILAQASLLPLCPPKGKGLLGAIFHEQTLFHPLVVHFPIALWLTSALFDLFYVATGNRAHAKTSHYLIGLGLLAAVAAVNLGFCDSIPAVAQGVGNLFVDRHALHQQLGLAATAVYALSFLIRWRRPNVNRAVIIVLLVVGAALISVTGYLGGEVRLVM